MESSQIIGGTSNISSISDISEISALMKKANDAYSDIGF